MDDESQIATFIFQGVRADGGVAPMDVVPCAGRRAAVARAKAWLAQHRSCARVQIWRDGVLIEEVAAS